MEKDCAGNCLTISILRVFLKGLAEFPITQTSALIMTCFKSLAFVPLSAWKVNTWHCDTSSSEHYVFLLKCDFWGVNVVAFDFLSQKKKKSFLVVDCFQFGLKYEGLDRALTVWKTNHTIQSSFTWSFQRWVVDFMFKWMRLKKKLVKLKITVKPSKQPENLLSLFPPLLPSPPPHISILSLLLSSLGWSMVMRSSLR